MNKFNKSFSLFEDIVSGIFLIVGFTLMFYEVVRRYVFDSPTTWVNETSTIMVVWGIMLGLSLALRDNHHISVDLLYVKFPPKVQKAVDYFANIMGAIFCIFITYNGIVLVNHYLSSGQLSTETGIPMWIYFSVMPLAGFMFLLRFIERILKTKNNALEQHMDEEDITWIQ